MATKLPENAQPTPTVAKAGNRLEGNAPRTIAAVLASRICFFLGPPLASDIGVGIGVGLATGAALEAKSFIELVKAADAVK